jgi:OOP family OmpA-OmpF porin
MGISTKMSHVRMGGMVAGLAWAGVSGNPSLAAEPITGWYISGVAGLNFTQELPITQLGPFATNTQTANPNNLNVSTNVGGVGVLGGGYGFGNGFRTEFQFNYRYNGLSSISGQRGNTASFRNNNGGSEQKYGPMPTLYYDFYTLSPDYLPYVGIGVGYQLVREQISIGGNSTNSTRGGFATQAILGVAFPIDSVPGLSMTTDYRFLAIPEKRTYNKIQVGADLNHAITIGVRYAFNSPPPPAPPAPIASPVPAAARSYLVFFDWDKADLTDRARQIIADAAAGSTRVQYTRLEVNGYTDTSGTPKYNQGLSVRRAQAVAGELVKDGVPKSAIVIQGFGESHPLVPTGPNVREPQNRRVEIIIR